MCFEIIHAKEREENIARQRSPITRETFAALLDLAKKSTVNSIEAVVADWFTFIRLTGSENAVNFKQARIPFR